ncbi:MAG: hypothetical protein ACYC3S_16690 [Chloroflexota bacterium]
MDPYRHRTPNPYRRRHDLGLLSIFFLTLTLLFGVIAVLTVGSAWTLPTMPQVVNVETRSSGLFGASAVGPGAVLPGVATPTPVKSDLPLVVQGQPSPTTAPTSPTASPTPTVTPTPSQGQSLVLGNTGGVGAWLRRTPHMNDYLIAWVDGTRMTVMGSDVQSDGLTWKNVQDPQGNKGYIPAEWLVPEP